MARSAPDVHGRSVGHDAAGPFGRTVVEMLVLLAMLRFSVPAVVRVAVLVVPFAAVDWWLVSPSAPPSPSEII